MKVLKTPLRYPGGKSKAIKTLSPWFPKTISEYREPFIGGGSIAIEIPNLIQTFLYGLMTFMFLFITSGYN